MKLSKRLCGAVAACTLITLAAPAFGQPVITELNGDVFPRSGRVALTGSGFGTQGEVSIAGITAWTATWRNDRVVAYVPEEAALGSTTVQLFSGGLASNEIALTVTLRQPDGPIRWIFETDGDDQWHRPALAPDGTIYMHTNNETDGLVYALSPDGGLKWIQKVNWYPYVPPTAGPDGAVYVGSINTITRISAQGDIDWTFSNGLGVEASPTVGPDGLLYGAYEISLGAIALDPLTGQLQWANDPGLSAFATGGKELRFGRPGPGEPIDRFYFYWDALYAFSLDGDFLFVNGTANTLGHEPAIGSDGTIYMPGWLEAYLVAHSPDDGSVLWQTNDPWLAGISEIEIGPDDTLYFISDGRWVDAFDPSTQSSIWRHDTGEWLRRPTLSPDATFLLTSGGGFQGQIPAVKCFATSSGDELWTVNLQEPYNPNFRHVPLDHPRISADSGTAYVPTWTAQWPFHDGDPRATLFAIDTGQGPDETFVRGDTNGDNGLDIGDTVYTLSALFVPGNPPLACDDAGDANDDGTVNISDPVYTLTFLFGSGPPPPAPHPDCGLDATSSDTLDCTTYSCP